MSPAVQAPTRSQVTISLLIGSVALMITGVQPIILGVLVDAHRLSLDRVGVLAMGEIIALGIGVVLGDRLPLRHFRRIAIWAALAACAFNLASAVASSEIALIGLRALAGLANGVLLWTSACIIVRSGDPERIAGIFMIVQTLAQVGVAALIASVAVPLVGWAGGFVLLALLSAVAALLAISQPVGLMEFSRDTGPVRMGWTLNTILPMTVILLGQAAIGALWVYLEPIGQELGLTAHASQTVISGVLAAQLAGGAVGTFLVKRVDAVSGLVAASALLACIGFGLNRLTTDASLSFIILAECFGFIWLFSCPFQIALALRVDVTGRLATLVPAVQLLGGALGPLIASVVVGANTARPAILASAGFSSAATIFLLAWQRRSRRIASAI